MRKKHLFALVAGALLGPALVLPKAQGADDAGSTPKDAPVAPKVENACPAGGCNNGCCYDSGCFCNEGNCDNYNLWASGEYLLWWFKSAPTPNFLDIAPANLAAGPPTPLLGGNNVDLGTRSGGRFTIGAFGGGCDPMGVEGSFFFIANKSKTQTATITNTKGTDPFFLIPLLQPGSIPGVTQGLFLAENDFIGSNAANTMTVKDELWGFEINGIIGAIHDPGRKLDLIAGFRYMQFEETVQFAANFNSPSIAITPPFVVNVPLGFPVNIGFASSFADQNRFYGANLGVRGERTFSSGLFVGASAKLALGVMEENFTRTLGLSVAVPGFMATPLAVNQHFNNSGHFAVVPEVNVNVGYELASWARAYVGYDFLAASDVMRPGYQANPASLFLPPAITHTDFWAQGVHFGVEFRF